jgi:SMODS and SLOG-associating 2TM effector domain family 4
MNNNLSIIRQQFAQTVFNHKIQEKASDRNEKNNDYIKYISIFILFIVLIFFALQIKYPNNWLFWSIWIWITIFEILFQFVQKEFSFSEKAKQHKLTALQYLSLRWKYLNLVWDCFNWVDEQEIILHRDLLQEQYNIISNIAPQTTYDDYKKTQLALLWTTNSDEEFTWSDREINLFLPSDLHI